jgi:hypothetical protein
MQWLIAPISGSLVSLCSFRRDPTPQSILALEVAMPTDLPQRKKTERPSSGFQSGWLARPMNWIAVIVGIGLCLWAINYGVI